jgi:hypothetical protein
LREWANETGTGCATPRSVKDQEAGDRVIQIKERKIIKTRFDFSTASTRGDLLSSGMQMKILTGVVDLGPPPICYPT